MTRFEKKCLVASTGSHLLLVLVLVFGSAFFTDKKEPPPNPKLRFYPSKMIDAALAGGGGNPKLPQTDDVQKGIPNPNLPAVSSPNARELPQPKPLPPQPLPPEPAPPKPPTPKKAEPKKPEAKVEPPKPEPKKNVKPEKVVEKQEPPKHKIDLTELQPVSRADREKELQKEREREKQQQKEREERQRKEAEEREAREARERAAAEREAFRQATLERQRLARRFEQTAESMGRGFSSGTKVDVGGPGGEAYANYGALVQKIYADAWRILPDLNDDDFITTVRVVINRDGRVVSSEIVRRSGSGAMDRSVQKALDRVRVEGLPKFPDFIKDAERSFTIEFNLKTRRLAG